MPESCPTRGARQPEGVAPGGSSDGEIVVETATAALGNSITLQLQQAIALASTARNNTRSMKFTRAQVGRASRSTRLHRLYLRCRLLSRLLVQVVTKQRTTAS